MSDVVPLYVEITGPPTALLARIAAAQERQADALELSALVAHNASRQSLGVQPYYGQEAEALAEALIAVRHAGKEQT